MPLTVREKWSGITGRKKFPLAMPKSSKKKKDKAADFTKTKLKLGKGKRQPTNAVDTSFKARSIALPTQSITVEKDTSEPLTKRHLGFSDLISHLKHHNAGTRRDAILGLQELFDSNWQLITSHLTPLLSALVRLIGDEDVSVRKQLISFFTWLLPKVPKDDLLPHSPLLVLFSTSAQTHIFPEIRIDAIRLLHILLEYIPETVTAGWSDRNERHGSRVLGGYLGILNAGTTYGDGGATSAASVVLTLASKLTVLRSLAAFLRTCLSSLEGLTAAHDDIPGNRPLNAWFLSGVFSSQEAFQSYDRLFTPEHQSTDPSRHIHRQERVDPDDEERGQFVDHFPLLQETIGESWTLDDLSLLDLNGLSGSEEQYWSSQSSHPEFVAHLCGTLHSTIIETYLDCAPSVFSPGSNPSETEVYLVLTVIQIAQSLYRYLIQNLQNIRDLHIDHLREIVNHMTPYFPASNGRDTKTEQAFEEFNLSFCSLTSLLLKAPEISKPSSLRSTRMRRPLKKKTSFSPVQTARVTEYIARRLSGNASASSNIAVPITPIAYVTLLPSIWTFVSDSTTVTGNGGSNGKHKGSHDLLCAVVEHAVKVPSRSLCKRATVEFVGKLLLTLDTSPHYLGPNLALFEGNQDFSLQPSLEAWLLHLPQVLWELGSSNIPLTETILRMLLRTLQRRFNNFPRSSNFAANKNAAVAQAHNNVTNASMISYHQTLTSLESRLVPFFFINHPTHGALAGPFRKLSNPSSSSPESSTRTCRVGFLALDVAATLLGLDKASSISGGTSIDAEALEKAVSLSLSGENLALEGNAMATEMRKYWGHVRRQ